MIRQLIYQSNFEILSLKKVSKSSGEISNLQQKELKQFPYKRKIVRLIIHIMGL